MALEESLRELQSRIGPLERLIEVFAGSLDAPKLRHSLSDRGFRYDAPDVRHFCLLKAVRVVSALNAAFELARNGYTQEIAALMRTLIECSKHIEYVLDIDESEEHRSNVQKYVREFFEDSRRDGEAEIKSVLVREGVVNAQLGKTLDKMAEQYGDTQDRIPADKRYWKVSRAFSLYVHARYPECMDLYGGRPGQFHLRGMSGTSKDAENLEQLESFIETASNTFVIIIQQLKLRDLVADDPMVVAWYKSRME